MIESSKVSIFYAKKLMVIAEEVLFIVFFIKMDL